MEQDLSNIEGYAAVVEHFGHWPSFHDAVLDRFCLNLQGESSVSARTWNTSSEVDEQGYFRMSHQATVDFLIDDIATLNFAGEDLWAGSIVFGLELIFQNGVYELRLDPCLGIGGSLTCKSLKLALHITT